MIAVLTGACASPAQTPATGARSHGDVGVAGAGVDGGPGVGTGWGQLAGGEDEARPDASSADGGEKAGKPESQAELAKQLQNPVANLISVPIQSNWDYDIGPAHTRNYVAKVQPVIPVSISEDWNVIVRTIVPVIWTQSPVDKNDTKFGLGDTVQSFFFSPKAPTSDGWIWGVGPVFQWPTSTSDELGNGKTGAGPTALILKQECGWTYGVLANHIWSFAGQDNTSDVNSTFVQPFLSYTTATNTTFAVNTESTYDWEERQWTTPFNASVSQLVKIGGLPVQFQIGYRYYAHTPYGGPDWGIRFGITLLFK